MLYTQKDCFTTTVREIKTTDLIEYSIDLLPNIKLVKSTLLRYTVEEREFANRIFPKLKDTRIIIRRSSPQGYRTKFPPKKKGSPLLRVVYNFILVNTFTIKLGYPTHHLKEVVNTLIKVKFYYFFSTNAVNGYQAITIKVEDRNKTRFLILNG